MALDFPTILVLLTIFTGIVTLVDMIYCRLTKNKKVISKEQPIIIEYCRSFFPVLLIVLLIRSFIVQPYRVPTGSLEPTVMPGDFILVNQFQYGLRMPAWKNKLLRIKEPRTGEVALFYWPVNSKVTFVKRVIGLPGDHISYIHKVLYINGKEATQKFIGYATDRNDLQTASWKVAEYQENLNGVVHHIYVCASEDQCPNRDNQDFFDLVVPPGKYFMMGDNRDNSDDSRDWGFVSEKDLIGKAFLIWMNWNPLAENWSQKILWNRIGKRI